MTACTVPDGVTTVGDYAFAGCSNLTSITLPDTVTSIGKGLCYYAQKLTSVTLSAALTEIPQRAFYACWKLGEVTLPEAVTALGEESFAMKNAAAVVKVNVTAGAILDGEVVDGSSEVDFYYPTRMTDFDGDGVVNVLDVLVLSHLSVG